MSESSRHTRLILFMRYPVPGRTKTRLIPALGPEGAARLQRRLALRTLRAAEVIARGSSPLEIHFEGGTEGQMRHWLGDRFKVYLQTDGDLGQRLAWAFEQSFRHGSQGTVIIGSDCPGLTANVLAEAFDRLREHPVVLGPANDGGYYLIGLRQALPQIFSGIPWGSADVLADTLKILKRLGITPALLAPLGDLDRPEDLAAWHRTLAAEEADANSVSVVIPALNEAPGIAAAVTSAFTGGAREVVVVDGGSADETVQRARQAGAGVLTSSPGRARQMNAGASWITGDILLFLHADTTLPEAYSSAVAAGLRESTVAAGAFRFAIAEKFVGRRLVEHTTNFRSRWLHLPYGDQALFLRRALFEELGGFADLPILEDYEFVRRVRACGRVITLPIPAVTSGRRWAHLGVLRTTLINKRVILGYHLGRPVEQLAATYRRAARRPQR